MKRYSKTKLYHLWVEWVSETGISCQEFFEKYKLKGSFVWWLEQKEKKEEKQTSYKDIMKRQLAKFAREAKKKGYRVLEPKTRESRTFLTIGKDKALAYVQIAQFDSGFDFSTVNKPRQEGGTGSRAIDEGELSFDNLNKALSSGSIVLRPKTPIKYYEGIDEYKKGLFGDLYKEI